MTLWKNGDAANNQPKCMALVARIGSGRAAQAANNTALYQNTTANALRSNLTIGVEAVTPVRQANSSGEGPKATAAGWNFRRAWQGPVVSVTCSGGSGFANGETATLSNGTSNSTITLTSNATGNLASGVVTVAGQFTNTSQVAVGFNREKHMNNISVTGGTGYNNSDYIVASNGTLNATANVSTNTTGGFVNAGITITNVGLWANTKANTNVQFNVYAANGAASNGSGATLVANLSTSSSGTITPVLGGRAGRVHYECFAELSSISSNSTSLP